MENTRPALRGLILDIDGTLIDSNEAHLQSWGEAFRHFGLDIPEAELEKQIGKGADLYVPEFLDSRQMQSFSKELKELKKKLYLEKYRPHVKPFSGVAERLRELHERDRVLVLASSSDEDEVKYSISLLGIGSLLKGYTSKDDAQHSKPSPEIFQAALEKADTPVEGTITVGDTPFDVAASHRACLTSVALLCGGFSRDTLEKAEFVFDDFIAFADSIDLVERSLKQ